MTQGINPSLRYTMHEDAPEVASAKERAGLVAIMVPAKNPGPFFVDCISSLQGQTYTNIRIVIVDNSNDGTFDIAVDRAKADPRILLHKQKDGKIASARNQCLNVANALRPDYLMFVDADDYVDLDYVEKMLAFLTKSGADIVSGSFYEVKGDIKWRYRPQLTVEPMLYSGHDAARVLLEDRDIISHLHGKLFKANLWGDIRLDPTINYCEDRAVCFRPFLCATKVFNTNYAGYYYREDNENALCAEEWHNLKILSTYKAYLVVAKDTSVVSDKELRRAAYSALFRLHLSLYPRFDFRFSTSDEIKEMRGIMHFIKTNRLKNYFRPIGKKEKAKKAAYVLSKTLYRILFRVRLRNIGST